MSLIVQRPLTEEQHVGWRQTVRQLHWRRDLALPVVVACLQFGAAAAAEHYHHHHLAPTHLGAGDWLLLAVGPAALIFRRRYPVAVMWVTFVATLGPSGSRLAYLSLIVSFFVAATQGHRRAAWVVIVVGYVGSLWLAPPVWGDPWPTLDGALLLGAWLAVLVIAAEAWRLSRERLADAQATRQADARRRASEERLRMARDLHDTIGHTISLINVQAGVGLDLMESRPDQARAALAAIRTVSKEALDEFRLMLTALRQEDEAAPRAPAPGLDRLPELVSLTRAAGLAVTTEVTGRRRPLPTPVDLAAYRIAQESLTNVARHAGPAAVVLHLDFGTDTLVLEISDDGRSGPHPGRPDVGTDVGTGSGIAGMRDRAAALGGHLDAGPRPGGGFRVRASLPIGGPA